VKEKMREAKTGHFTETGDGAQVWRLTNSGYKLTFAIVPLWFYACPNWDDESETTVAMLQRTRMRSRLSALQSLDSSKIMLRTAREQILRADPGTERAS
jgi:hypothetical protein